MLKSEIDNMIIDNLATGLLAMAAQDTKDSANTGSDEITWCNAAFESIISGMSSIDKREEWESHRNAVIAALRHA